MLKDEFFKPAAGEPLCEPLTRRERDVLGLLAQGYSAPEIAEKLTLAISSVKSHTQHLYGKLGVGSKREAVERARELELLELDPDSTLVTKPLQPANPRAGHNLPHQVTRFFGRVREAAQLVDLIVEHPLVTLTGTGGVGKTRLSLRVAADMLEDFPGGLWLAELAALSNPALLPQHVAAALGVRDEPNRPILDSLTAFLRPRAALLVLDNCEHLVDACAALCEALLRACPRLRILATSREPLAAYGELVFRIPSLDYPATGESLSPECIDDFAAVSMFVDRARLVRPDYQLTPQNAAAVARICQLLDGIPLAIEMAAARVNLLTAEQLADRLDDAFHVLTVGSRTALPRHKTLRATIDWSYQFLNGPERLLLQRLSVFAGGCTLEAAESVCAGDGLEAGQTLDILGSLAAKSMVNANRGTGHTARYQLLETIRQYAWEKVREAGETNALQARHLNYFLHFAEEAELKLRGSEQMACLNRMDAEFDNFRAAMDHCQSGVATDDRKLRLMLNLGSLWRIRGHFQEMYSWLEAALAAPQCVEQSLWRARVLDRLAGWAYKPEHIARARGQSAESVEIFRAAGRAGQSGLAYALIRLGNLTHDENDFAPMRHMAEESAAIFRQIGDKWGLAVALSNVAPTRDPLVNYLPRDASGSPPFPGLAPGARNDHTAHRALFQESLSLFRELGDLWSQQSSLFQLGVISFCTGDRAQGRAILDECLAIFRQRGQPAPFHCVIQLAKEALADEDLELATKHYEACLEMCRRTEDPHTAAWVQCDLAEVARRRGDYGQASALLEDALPIRRQVVNRSHIAGGLDAMGRLALSQGDTARACSLQLEALHNRLDARHPVMLGYSFHALAVLAATQQQAERAARLFGAAQPYHWALYRFHMVPPIWHVEHERAVAIVRAQLGDAEMARLMAEGEAMTLQEAVDFVLSAAP